jgi:hypothetical protein
VKKKDLDGEKKTIFNWRPPVSSPLHPVAWDQRWWLCLERQIFIGKVQMVVLSCLTVINND